MVAGREEKSVDVQIAEIRSSIKKLFALIDESNRRVVFLRGVMITAGILKTVPNDDAFDGAKPALDQRTRMVRKMFARAREVKYAEADLKNMIKTMWNFDSTKEMAIEQIGVVLNMLDGMASHRKGTKS